MSSHPKSNDRVSVSPQERFSNRADTYARYRPSYPAEVLDAIVDAMPSGVVADVGAGTGIFARLLADRGYEVHAIEPNQAMSEYGSETESIRWHNGSAEETGLPDQSVDLITAAQAFHWFDKPAFRIECNRILKPKGMIALVWNIRDKTTPFGSDLAEIIAPYSGARTKHHEETESEFKEFFNGYERRDFKFVENLDFEALAGRLHSASYMPVAGTPEAAPMLAKLQEVFDRHRQGDTVEIAYITELFIGT